TPHPFPARTDAWVGLRMAATALGSRLSFIAFDGISSERLLALTATPEGLREAWLQDVPKDVLLLTDHGSRCARVLAMTEDGLEAAALGPAPPALSGWEHPYHSTIPELFESRPCAACYLSDAEQQQVRTLKGRITPRTLSEQAGFFRQM